MKLPKVLPLSALLGAALVVGACTTSASAVEDTATQVNTYELANDAPEVETPATAEPADEVLEEDEAAAGVSEYLVGTWIGSNTIGDPLGYDFHADGSFGLFHEPGSEPWADGMWSVAGDQLILNRASGSTQTITFSLDGELLTLFQRDPNGEEQPTEFHRDLSATQYQSNQASELPTLTTDTWVANFPERGFWGGALLLTFHDDGSVTGLDIYDALLTREIVEGSWEYLNRSGGAGYISLNWVWDNGDTGTYENAFFLIYQDSDRYFLNLALDETQFFEFELASEQ